LDARNIHCPYCGETHTLLVEPPTQPVRYTEDCSVCCQPIEVVLTPLPDGEIELSAHRENE
jgi:hypothetical protein